MNIPTKKNRRWIARLHDGIGNLDENMKRAIMRPAGEACASDLILLCKNAIGKEVSSVEDLVAGWNAVRAERELTGRWEIKGDTVRGVFDECGCPLVRSGLIALHPVQCYCSQGLMEAIFSRVSGKSVTVEINRTIGRGDDACDFLIKLR
jgi:predicted hydrocarbon binding protein